MEKIQITLFSDPRLSVGSQEISLRRRKSLAVMAYLAMTRQAISRDKLAELLWTDTPLNKSRASLRTALYELTSEFDVDWLIIEQDYISINHEMVELDVDLFKYYVTQARQHRHEDDILCEHCLIALQNAEQLYKNRFLGDFYVPSSPEFGHWQSVQTDILQREYESFLARLAHHYHKSATVGIDKAITYTIRWLQSDVLHEPAHRLLMQIYAENGQRSKALQQYQQCVEILDQELATPPEEATTRLFEAIRDGEPVTTPAHENTGTFYSALPPLPALIIGRGQAMQDVKSRLGISGKQRSTMVIQGLPGVGKSTLVATLAHDEGLRNQFPDGILWTSLGEEPDITSKLQAWSNALNINLNQSESNQDLSTRITAVVQNKRMLLIVDDVWQVDHSQFFRVNGTATSIIFTTRLNDVALALAPSQLDLYNLSVLTDDDALKLLHKLTPDTVNEHPEEARELVYDLEGLPLAIQVAGRLLHAEARLGWGVADLLQELRDGAKLLDAPAPSDMLHQDTKPTIAALLKRSTDILNANTRERFALLGLLVPKPATFDLGVMQAIWDTDNPKATARELVNRGLLEPVGGGRFQMHALLVLHAKSLLSMPS